MAIQGNSQNMLYFRGGDKTGSGILKHTICLFLGLMFLILTMLTCLNCISKNHPECWSVITIWSSTRENLTFTCKQKCTNQLAQLPSLVSTFVIRYLESIVAKLVCKISII